MYFGHRVRRAIPRSVQPWPSGSTFVRTAINQACTACRQARVPGEAKPACAGENRAPHSRSGRDAASGARASGAHPDRDAPAPQGLPRAQGGLQPALSRCALHDAQPPPSPFVGGGKTAASGARASGAHPGRDAPAPQGLPRAQGGLQPAPSLVARFTTPNLPLLLLWAVGKPPPQVRAPPARTPTETLQPRRGFHALREGFSPHPLSLRAPRRPTSPFAFCERWEKRRLRCARLRRAPRQRRSSPAGASTRSERASARTLSRCALHDAQPPPSPPVGAGGMRGNRALFTPPPS
jgi:hypothetical protein